MVCLRVLSRSAVGGLALGASLAAAQPSASRSAAPDDGEIVVTGRAARLYRAPEISSGRLPTDPLESAQVINVITEQLIEDQGARDAQDLYRNIPGVSVFSYAGVTARGFRQEEIFYDGLRGDPYAGFAVPQLFNIARVEVLKGPAGMLYGPGAPGGLFNYITERPRNRFSAELRAILGTGDRYGGSAEITGALGGGFAGRFGLFYEDRDTFRFNTGSETLIGDIGLSHDFGPATLILQATRYDQELAGNRLRGVPVDNEGRFLTTRRWNHNEPSDFLRLDSTVLQARLEARPAAGLTFDATVRYNRATERQQYHEPNGLFDSNGDGAVDSTLRQFRDQERDEDIWSLGANAVWTHDFGGVRGRTLIGGDYYAETLDFASRSLNGQNRGVAGRPSPLSLFNPVYGQSDSRTYALPAFTFSVTESTRWGGYALQELTVGRLILTGGLRYDTFEDDTGTARFEDEELTWRAGAVFRVRPDISLFAQYATSFEPQSAANQDPRAGGPFAPTVGDIYEAGIRTALMNGRIQSTASVYRIRRRNILQADPRGDVGGDGINDLVAFGEVTSKGFEFDLAADITPNWVLTASYAYNDTRITATNGRTTITNSVGDRFANAPEHEIGFWTRYQFPALGLAVALGGDYVSERLSLDGQRVRPYVVFDASLIWERGPWRVLLRGDNIFDRTYAASGFITRTGHFPGQPRSVFLEVTRRW